MLDALMYISVSSGHILYSTLQCLAHKVGWQKGHLVCKTLHPIISRHSLLWTVQYSTRFPCTVSGIRLSFHCSVCWCHFDRRKKRCIRFVADGETEYSGDEADNSTAMSSVPLAADSTTEIFSPMPLSASSSNPDDALGVGGRPSAGGETESQSSVSSVGVGNVPLLCDGGMSSVTYATNVPKPSRTASAPSASGGGGGHISSTIGELKCKDSWDRCKVRCST